MSVVWYATTVEQIRRIVHWLESTDEEGWPDQTALAEEAISDVERMAAPKRRRDKGPVEIIPGDANMQRARPHVRAMVLAMKSRDRLRALENGRAALREY
jgi:hypothetical protein